MGEGYVELQDDVGGTGGRRRSAMTVSYQYDVASSTSGGFTRLLFKWKGSLYKLIYKELILYCIAFAGMSCVYRFVFTREQKR